MGLVLTSLLPVVFLIAVGVFVGFRGWVTANGSKELSNLAFMVLAPALLFRTMSRVHVSELDVQPVVMYFVAAIALFVALFLTQGVNRRSSVLALATTYSNLAMLGIPLVGLVYGPQGLVYLFTLISMHALILLTLATVVFELVLAHENAQHVSEDQTPRHPVATIAMAIKNAIIHPVPMPILVGLAVGQTGWVMPEVLDQPIQWLGSAFGPVALLMVGITLASVWRDVWRSSREQSAAQAVKPLLMAVFLTLLKNLVHPLLVLGLGIVWGLQGMALSVMVFAAAMPIGANVFLFSQRYDVGQDTVPAAVALSTVLALLTVPWVLSWVH